jgi:hypothetical protein
MRHGRANVTLKTTSTLWTAAVAALTITVAHGQDATRSGAPSANQSSPATSTSAPAAQDKAAATDPAAGASTGTTAAAAGNKPAPICFKLTGRCVDPAKAPTAKAGATGDASAKRPLNLNAPDVRTVVPADELKEPLLTNEQIAETQEADTVAVKGNKDLEEAPLGFGAIWWALNHPSQAWRIFTPVE